MALDPNKVTDEITNNLIHMGLFSQHEISQSIKEVNMRLLWDIASFCLIYSRTSNTWSKAQIINIFIDETTNEEWLRVKYDEKRFKNIQRFNQNIKPTQLQYESNHKIIQIIANELKSKAVDDDIDILQMIETTKGTLFENIDEKKNEKECIKRIKFVLEIYTKWMKNNKKTIDIRDIIDHKLSEEYNYNSFLCDERVITDLNRDILNENEEKNGCSADECIVLDRDEYNEKGRMDSYFNINNENENKSICAQMILDSAHSLIYHTVYVDIGDIEAGFANENRNNIDTNALCDDLNAQKVRDLIEAKRKSSNRYREPRVTNTHNKFQTVNTFKASPSSNKVSSNENTKNPQCFVDVLFIEMKQNQIEEKEISEIDAFIFAQEYESESVIFDLEHMDGLNFKYSLNVSKKFQEFANKLIKERRIAQNVYSGGKRYFYWKYYKENINKRNVVWEDSFGPLYEENIGYKLCEWYISAKYSNLKDEIFNNLICNFSVKQYETTLNKANDKWMAWVHDKHIKNIRCDRSYWSKTYGINRGDEITLEHILSIMFYTNYSEHCYEFSATFRKMNEYESDEDMKKRHQEFAIWGRLLRETVECFGNTMQRSSIKTFYHGISESLVFDSTSVHLFGPVSTTSDFHVASGAFSRGGLVLSINNGKGFHPFFDCPYWSHYTAERERLFIGGLQVFQFNTIRNMASKPVQNYYDFVQSIRMFALMIEGCPWRDKIKKESVSTLRVLIEDEIEQKMLKEMPSEVPPYILNLWHHVLLKIKKIEIHWGLMISELFCEVYGEKQWGYKAFSSLFLSSDLSSLDFSAFINILPNLERIELNHYYNDGNIFEWRQTVSLNETFKIELIKGILSRIESSSLCSIHIVNPSSDIDDFVNQNKNEFNEYNWNLAKQPYQNKYTKQICENSLFIYKL